MTNKNRCKQCRWIISRHASACTTCSTIQHKKLGPLPYDGILQLGAIIIRRMSKVLTLANWRKEGKFYAGSRRNQVRFVNQNTLSDAPKEQSFDF